MVNPDVAESIGCPMCGRTVDLPKPEPAERAASLDRPVVILGIVVTLAVAAALPIFLLAGNAPPPTPAVTYVLQPDTLPASFVDRPQPPVPAPPPAAPPAFPHLDSLVASINMAALASEHARLSGDQPRQDVLQTRIRVLIDFLKADLESIRADGLTAEPRAHLAPDDVVVSCAGANLASMKPAEAAMALRLFVENLAPGTKARIVVRREGAERTIEARFKEPPADIDAIFCTVRRATLTAAAPATSGSRTESAIAARLEQTLIDAPAYYVSMLAPEDFQKVSAILGMAAPTAEDTAYVNKICDYIHHHWHTEQKMLEHELKHAQEETARQGQRDMIRFMDGSRRPGTVLSETDETITIEFTNGRIRGNRAYPRGEVGRIERGVGPGVSFPGRLAKCGEDIVLLAELMQWCGQNGLGREGDCLALRILLRSPDHATARTAFGFRRNPRGVWELF